MSDVVSSITFSKNGNPWVANEAVNFAAEKRVELGPEWEVWMTENGGDMNPNQTFTVHWIHKANAIVSRDTIPSV